MTAALAQPAIDRYDAVARLFHWATALLVIANLITGLAHDALEGEWNAMPFHKACGLTVLIMAAGRLAWRLAHRPPPWPPVMHRWQRAAATAVHAAFYALIFVMPITGWIMSSASKYPLSWFGLFAWPKLAVAKDSPLADAAHEGHEVLGFVFIGLLALHIIAALHHQFVSRDGLIRRMI